MPDPWPTLPPYAEWKDTCDTLHAHTQVLGKLAATLAPPEPELQHGALRLTTRGIETRPLPAPDGSGAFSVALNLHRHGALVEHSNGAAAYITLVPDMSVGFVTREILEAVGHLAGQAKIDPAPQEVDWTVPLDEDEEHASFDMAAVENYFAAASRAALVLEALRAPYRGRSTAVNTWWGSFDIAVSLFSGRSADPPSEDFIVRNSMDAQEMAFGWWPGDARYAKAAFYAYAHPATDGFETADLAPARWEPDLGYYVLDWDDVVAAEDPFATALEFTRAILRHGCEVCDWDAALAASAMGDPPPVS